MPERPFDGARASAHSSSDTTELEQAVKACRAAFGTCAVLEALKARSAEPLEQAVKACRAAFGTCAVLEALKARSAEPLARRRPEKSTPSLGQQSERPRPQSQGHG